MSEGLPPSDDELLKQLEEELKTLKVSDLLVQTLYTVSSLGYLRLSEQDRDLTPFVQAVRRWWGEASALRDPARASQVPGNLPA